MSGTILDRGTETSQRFHAISLLDNLAAAGALGALFGVVDFFLFEAHGQRSNIHEFVLSKPSFWSLSILSYQLVFWTLIAIIVCLLAFLSIKITSNRFSSVRRFSTLNLTVLSIFSLIMTLRILQKSQQYINLFWFIVFSLTIIVFVLLLENGILKKLSSPEYRHSNRNFIFSLLTTVFIIFVTFFAPDISSEISRFSSHADIQNSDSPNVLLIVLDTVRPDHLSCYGYKDNETPNIDRIARDGLLFLNAFSTAPWTVPSHASMFTGLYPSQHGADWSHTYLTSDHLTLAEYLQGVGYRTAGFSENPYVGPDHGFARGFAEFHESWRRPMIVRTIKKLDAKLGLRKDPLEYADRTSGLFRHWLIAEGENDRPFFAYINFMAAHLPRYPRPPFDSGRWSSEELQKIEPVNLVPERFYLEHYRLNQRDLSVMREIYDQEISYIDGYIGDIFDFLVETEILEKTILIITSDHGENFGEHGFFEHQLCIYNTLIHVPLIIRFPKSFSPQKIDARVSTVEIFPTIVDILNASRNELTSTKSGTESSAFNWINEDQKIIAEYANGVGMMKSAIRNEAPDFDFTPFDRQLKTLIMGDYKYIWDSTGREELYDLGVDPQEENDIATREGNMILQFRRILAESTEAGQNQSLLESIPPIDGATRDALKALGYEP